MLVIWKKKTRPTNGQGDSRSRIYLKNYNDLALAIFLHLVGSHKSTLIVKVTVMMMMMTMTMMMMKEWQV